MTRSVWILCISLVCLQQIVCSSRPHPRRRTQSSNKDETAQPRDFIRPYGAAQASTTLQVYWSAQPTVLKTLRRDTEFQVRRTKTPARHQLVHHCRYHVPKTNWDEEWFDTERVDSTICDVFISMYSKQHDAFRSSQRLVSTMFCTKMCLTLPTP